MRCGAVGITTGLGEYLRKAAGAWATREEGGLRKAINDQHLSTLLMTGVGVYPVCRPEGQSRPFM